MITKTARYFCQCIEGSVGGTSATFLTDMRFTPVRDTFRLILIGPALAAMVSAASAEDLEFYDSSSQSVPKSLMDESGLDINVSTREVRKVLKRHSDHENAQYDDHSDAAPAA